MLGDDFAIVALHHHHHRSITMTSPKFSNLKFGAIIFSLYVMMMLMHLIFLKHIVLDAIVIIITNPQSTRS